MVRLCCRARYDLETQRRPNLTHNIILRSRGAQTLRTIWFRRPEAPKPYAQYDFEAQKRPNLTHNMILTSRGAQTLRTIWFGDPEAPKPYAQYDLETQRRPNLTHNMIWRPRGAQKLTPIVFPRWKNSKFFVFGLFFCIFASMSSLVAIHVFAI